MTDNKSIFVTAHPNSILRGWEYKIKTFFVVHRIDGSWVVCSAAEKKRLVKNSRKLISGVVRYRIKGHRTNCKLHPHVEIGKPSKPMYPATITSNEFIVDNAEGNLERLLELARWTVDPKIKSVHRVTTLPHGVMYFY